MPVKMANLRMLVNNFKCSVRIFGSNASKKHLHTTSYLRYDDTPPADESQRFTLANVKGQFEIHKMPKDLLENEFNYPLSIDQFRQKLPGYYIEGKFVYIKEMEPELIVPDLTGFQLKPYVSFQAGEIEEPPLTAKAIFDKVYAPEVLSRIEAGKPVKTNLSAREIHIARIKAQQTGADLLSEENHYGVGSDYWPTHAPRRPLKKRRNPRKHDDIN